MITLTPKILDIVKFRTAHTGFTTGTVLSLSGEPSPISAFIEVANEVGETSGFFSIPIKDLEVIWSAERNAQQTPTPDAQKLFEQGILLLQNGLLNEAAQQFASAFATEPKLAGTLMNLTNQLAGKASFDSAIFLYQLILRLQPTYSPARGNLARAYLNRGVASAKDGLLPEAIADFQHGLLFDSTDVFAFQCRRNIVAAYTALAIRHAEINQYGEALAFFMAAFQLEPSETTRRNLALATVGNLAVQSRGVVAHDPTATTVFAEAVLAGLTRSECLNAYGATLAGLGSLSDATRFLERAVVEDPENELAKKNLERLKSPEAAESPIQFWGVQEIPLQGVHLQL